jgi:TPR repeat protein
VEKNPVMAVKWFIKAARQGNKTAQHNLGVHYAVTEQLEEESQQAAEGAENAPT